MVSVPLAMVLVPVATGLVPVVWAMVSASGPVWRSQQ